MGSLFLKRKRTEEPTDAFFDYRVRVVMTRDNWDFEFNLLFSHLSKWPIAGAWSVKKNIIRI